MSVSPKLQAAAAVATVVGVLLAFIPYVWTKQSAAEHPTEKIVLIEDQEGRSIDDVIAVGGESGEEQVPLPGGKLRYPIEKVGERIVLHSRSPRRRLTEFILEAPSRGAQVVVLPALPTEGR